MCVCVCVCVCVWCGVVWCVCACTIIVSRAYHVLCSLDDIVESAILLVVLSPPFACTVHMRTYCTLLLLSHIGGVVWRVKCTDKKLVCAVGSRNGVEDTRLLVLDFDAHS